MYMDLLYLLLGLAIGGALAWALANMKMRSGFLPLHELEKKYVLLDMHQQATRQVEAQQAEIKANQQAINQLTGLLAAETQKLCALQEKLDTRNEELLQIQTTFKLEFENLAGQLLQEKSQQFAESNQKQIHDILQPLKERITVFENQIHQKFVEESRDRISLKKEIELLRELNQKLSQDATNLAGALKGDHKIQGDWGEFQLETLLQRVGLQKGTHYLAQPSYTDDEGKQKRPDFIIHLPEGKNMVIDSKVSLVAFERFFSAGDTTEQQRHLQQHTESIRRHIRDLGSKNYASLYQIHSPDYVLMFIPLESAFNAALQYDNKLFLEALEKNIVMVTASTLLATMRTVHFIWKQEKQKNSVQEIAHQSGLLYDKFAGFLEDLRTIGQRLESAQVAYHDAVRKLSDANRPGNSILGKIRKIKALGAKNTKEIPSEFLRADDDEG
jgi:DNA recombination protein RmuC